MLVQLFALVLTQLVVALSARLVKSSVLKGSLMLKGMPEKGITLNLDHASGLVYHMTLQTVKPACLRK